MEVKAWSYKQDSLAAGLVFRMRSSAQRPLLGALRAFERPLFRRADGAQKGERFRSQIRARLNAQPLHPSRGACACRRGSFPTALITTRLGGELDHIIDGDRYILSSRIQTLTAIRDKRRPPPVREPLPLLRHYAPPRAKASRRRG
jgi:hypothetical protein